MTASVDEFRALHAPGEILVLANAWDAASARMSEEAGAKAVATSSASLAWSHGYPDGEALAAETLLAALENVLRVVTAPVTVDSEAGYSSDPEAVADYAARLIDLGVAGINLEDGHEAPDLHARKIAAIKARAARMGGDLFVNARTDVYLLNWLKAMRRWAKRWRAPGAMPRPVRTGCSCPSCARPISSAKSRQVPICRSTFWRSRVCLRFAELKRLGVRRVSTGAGPGRAAYGAGFKAMQRCSAMATTMRCSSAAAAARTSTSCSGTER